MWNLHPIFAAALAPYAPKPLEPTAANAQLLCRSWQQTDSLALDLYGYLPDEDDGYIVESVYVAGSTPTAAANLCELFTSAQLDAMGEWLNHKESKNPLMRDYAERMRCEAMRPPYLNNRPLG